MKKFLFVLCVLILFGIGFSVYFDYLDRFDQQSPAIDQSHFFKSQSTLQEQQIQIPNAPLVENLKTFFEQNIITSSADSPSPQSASYIADQIAFIDPSVSEAEPLPCKNESHQDHANKTLLEIQKIAWVDSDRILQADPYYIRIAYKKTNQQINSCTQFSYTPIQIGDKILVESRHLTNDQVLDLCDSKRSQLHYVSQCKPFEIIELLKTEGTQIRPVLIEILKTRQRDLSTVQAISKKLPEVIFADWLIGQDPDHIVASFNFGSRLQSNNKAVVEDTLNFCYKHQKKCSLNSEDLARLESIVGREAFNKWINANPEFKASQIVPPKQVPIAGSPITALPALPPAPPNEAVKDQSKLQNPLEKEIQMVEIGKTYQISNGCSFEFADIAGKLDQEYIQMERLPENATEEIQKFFSCHGHLDRKLQARNNQRMKIKIFQLRSLCEQGDKKSCVEYAAWCQPPAK